MCPEYIGLLALLPLLGCVLVLLIPVVDQLRYGNGEHGGL